MRPGLILALLLAFGVATAQDYHKWDEDKLREELGELAEAHALGGVSRQFLKEQEDQGLAGVAAAVAAVASARSALGTSVLRL